MTTERRHRDVLERMRASTHGRQPQYMGQLGKAFPYRRELSTSEAQSIVTRLTELQCNWEQYGDVEGWSHNPALFFALTGHHLRTTVWLWLSVGAAEYVLAHGWLEWLEETL